MLTTTEHKTEHALTSDDIKALRKADDVSFHRLSDGMSHIRATKKPHAVGIFCGGDSTFREITVESQLVDYERESNRCGEHWSAFEMTGCANRLPEWQTIVGLLRVGHTIRLIWGHGAAGTIGIREAGMVGDSLHLEAFRGEKRLVFKIKTRVGHDNTARMIRR